MFSRTIKLFFILLLVNKVLIAGTMGVEDSSPQTLPQKNGWGVGGHALYLKPSFDSSFSYLGAVEDKSGHTSYIKKSPNWSWGFELEAPYYFSSTKDMTLNWYHMDGTTHFIFNDNFLVKQNVLAEYSSLLKQQWDAVNLEVGQNIHFDNYTAMRVFGSIQYAHINVLSKTNVLSTTDPSQLPVGDNLSYDLKLNAVGPRFGLDLYQFFPHHIDIYAKMAASLLAGKGTFSGVDALGDASIVKTKGDNFDGSHTAVTPLLEAKLGGSYKYSSTFGNLDVNAGYMWFNYFDACHLAVLTQTDFAASGLYFGLSWRG